jgi:DNA-binding MarR family transcriptional regulator
MPTPDEALNRFFQLTVLMSDTMEEDLAHRGLTRARATLIAHLHEAGPTIQNGLAQALKVTPRNITGLVNGLEARGLVRRSPHPTDRRAALIELTDDGSRAAYALARDEHELARFLFAGRTAAELTTFAVGFGELIARLTEPGFDAVRRTARRRWPITTQERRTGEPATS